MKTVLTTFLLPGLLLAAGPAGVPDGALWGGAAHEYINHYAVERLPAGMSFFLEQQVYLRIHAPDPDWDENPGYYHYIDIDFYQEFIDGTLPHEWDEMLALYDESEVRGVGIVPWVIQWWADSLSALMSRSEWESAWQVAAELGHYVADSHQPLHLTVNYNGQYTGNEDIHSRYETQLINLVLSQLPLPEGSAVYWDSMIDSVFGYIDEVYPVVSQILAADDLASSQDPYHGSIYYSVLWSELDSITTDLIHRATLNLASIWYTAWVNAGEPVPGLAAPTGDREDLTPNRVVLYPNFPNPFNTATTVRYALPLDSYIVLRLLDLRGREVTILEQGFRTAGMHTAFWDGRDHCCTPVSSGAYICRLETGGNSQMVKLLLLK